MHKNSNDALKTTVVDAFKPPGITRIDIDSSVLREAPKDFALYRLQQGGLTTIKQTQSYTLCDQKVSCIIWTLINTITQFNVCWHFPPKGYILNDIYLQKYIEKCYI